VGAFLVSLGVLAALGVVSLAVLTGLGAHRRGAGAPLVAAEAVFFPLTWVVWYCRDVGTAPYRARRG
jgi:hypothetical protein